MEALKENEKKVTTEEVKRMETLKKNEKKVTTEENLVSQEEIKEFLEKNKDIVSQEIICGLCM